MDPTTNAQGSRIPPQGGALPQDVDPAIVEAAVLLEHAWEQTHAALPIYDYRRARALFWEEDAWVRLHEIVEGRPGPHNPQPFGEPRIGPNFYAQTIRKDHLNQAKVFKSQELLSAADVTLDKAYRILNSVKTYDFRPVLTEMSGAHEDLKEAWNIWANYRWR